MVLPLEQTVEQEIARYAHSTITAAISMVVNSNILSSLSLPGKDDSSHLTQSEQEEVSSDSAASNPVTLVSYSFHRDQFLSSSYSSASGNVDHIEMMYGETKKPFSSSSDEEYLTGSPQVEDNLAETLTAEEAQETVREVQYAAVLGTFHDVSPHERQRLSTYGLFNTVFLMLNHTLHALTADVDYSRTI